MQLQQRKNFQMRRMANDEKLKFVHFIELFLPFDLWRQKQLYDERIEDCKIAKLNDFGGFLMNGFQTRFFRLMLLNIILLFASYLILMNSIDCLAQAPNHQNLRLQKSISRKIASYELIDVMPSFWKF